MKHQASKSFDFTHGSIIRELILFTIPIVTGELLQSLYNSVDALIVGNWAGAAPLAAVSACSQPVQLVVGFFNGMLLGSLAFAGIGLYVMLFKHYAAGFSFAVAACVGGSLWLAMIVSSLVGTLVPMFFHKIKVDPAVASGPLITTVNDLVAVVTYYGCAWIFLINLFHTVA